MKGKMVIFDIDGTLTDADHRLHYLRAGPKKDWTGFFRDMHLDTPREDIVYVLNMYWDTPSTRVVLLTGRDEEWRKMTVDWLEQYDIPYDELAMRPRGDRTNDDIIKMDIIKKWQDEGYQIIGFYEDRKRICDAARAHGITVFQVAAGEF